MPGFTEISPKSLMRLLGTPDAPQLLDVCLEEDFREDPRLIPTARRIPHGAVGQAGLEAAQRVVVVCQKGKKLSHGAAALLRAKGAHAEALAGGVHAWRHAGLAFFFGARIPRGPLWVKRHRPKLDRIACPWLIRRFIDPGAEFLFVPPAEVTEIARRFDAIPFDVPESLFHDGPGGCSFDALLAHFSLETEALTRLAKIIRAADLASGDAPEAAGLAAITVGLSRLFKDDQAQLTAGLPMYDALYRWARDGQSETHGHEGRPA
ncbi:MAG: chromate resistance protein ChrB domain-containing protein [Pseudomonadota bacterium]